MNKCLVTGATGFIGHYLVRELKKRGYWVRASGTHYNNFVNEADDFKKGSLVLKENCTTVVKDIDYVFHLAAKIGGIKYISENESSIMHDNAIMDMNMIEASAHSGVKKFFYSSSACVYPARTTESFNPEPITEIMAYPANPEVGYGWEKIYMEQTLARYQREGRLDIKIARFFSTYGPEMEYEGDNVKSLIALCRKVIEAEDGGEIEIWGPGKQTRAFCHVTDVVDGIIKLMESKHHGPYNIGNADSISINKLAIFLIRLSGKKLKIKNIPGTVGVKGRRCSSYLANKDLKWKREISLSAGAKETYEWVKGEMEK
jgi:GDP-D-mannose 3', 5'-epimerase